MTVSHALVRISAATLLLAATAASAPEQEVCTNRTGSHNGFFFTFWKSGGDACMSMGEAGRYSSRYTLASRENLVLGKGWRIGSADRKIGYRAAKFDAGSNSYLTLYGWSTDPLVEYYVVDSWGSAFTPPGEGAPVLGTVTSDGGTYNIYRTQRVQQPSIRGTRTFYQYWSVRSSRRPIGQDSSITFANHVAAWRALGMELGKMNYQVMATEGFGSRGGSAVAVWQQ
jgi:endo-1,4-beta-xylanase